MRLIVDAINAAFELGGGIAIFAHCFALLRDREASGVSPVGVVFFTAWGYWNLFYYPQLEQWLSFFGGLLIVAGNTTWVVLLLRFRHERSSKDSSL
jgi:uncharacterized membrane protein YfcA